MKIEQVVRRAMTDPAFASELKKAGEAAAEGGRGSAAHRHLIDLFGIDEAAARALESNPEDGHHCGLGTSAFAPALAAAMIGLTTGHCE